ncbi:amidase signature domain-containing protein [Leptodontidium sp. MPI-SDFR-AT-0119]|nr:amidase signature domain-containing protein [Leptodontidium sp. MPI-SDFR-AT-0119]
MLVPDTWQQISQKKKQEQQARITEEWKVTVPADLSRPLDIFKENGILTAEELQWTDPANDALTTLALVSSGLVTAEQLITAFCKRAAIAHAATNCLTEITFDAAIQRAKTLDEHFRRTGKVVGPLHGLPISVKDHMDVEGVDSSMGISSLCFDPAKQNGKLVQVLVDQGAVVIAKTNVPQTCLTADSDNQVFGRTLNPHNSAFGASGSSGGEGALIAMGGSLLGLASDGAGSIRMPSAANGVVGYKPSGYRLPTDGRPLFDFGMMGIVAIGPVGVFGFMGRSIRDIRAFTKLVCEQRIWDADAFLYPSPWIGIETPRPRIGVWTIDAPNTNIHLHPPVKRGFLVAQDRLRRAGYELVEFVNPDVSDIWEFQRDWIGIQGLSMLRKHLENEPLTNIAAKTGIMSYEPPTTVSVKYLHQLNMKLAGLVMAMTKAWSASGKPLDALLWVNAPHTALPWDTWTDTTFTSVFNAIDWPAVALPLGMKSDKKIDIKEDVVPWNEMDAKIQSFYDAESFNGLPLAVQLIGRRFEDEKLLGIAEQIHPILLGQ